MLPNDIKNNTQGFGGYFQVTCFPLYSFYSSQSGKVWALNGALPTRTFTEITAYNSNTIFQVHLYTELADISNYCGLQFFILFFFLCEVLCFKTLITIWSVIKWSTPNKIYFFDTLRMGVSFLKDKLREAVSQLCSSVLQGKLYEPCFYFSSE